MTIIKEMIGKVFYEVIQTDHETLLFNSTELSVKFYHEQDCCESVLIEQVDGSYRDLVNSPILMAEFESNQENGEPGDDSTTWTFYKFATTKGYVTIRWKGESNGYYSETVDVEINGKETCY